MSEEKSGGISWEGVSEDMARQILQQAETYLTAQWQAAIAADQRAVTAASIFVTTATAASGGAIAYWTTEKPDLHVVIAGLLAGGLLVAAAIFCFWSARPVPFNAPGNEPAEWWPHREGNITECIGGETENLQKHIESNNKVLARRGRTFERGFKLALCAPLLAVGYWLLATFWAL